MSGEMSGEKNTTADLTGEEGEDFIQRWARRKAEAEAAVTDAPADAPAAKFSSGAAEDETDPSEEAPPPALTDADMPPLDSLTGDSDVSAFFSAGVSEDLRRSALRKVFHSPKFNVCDGLDDYCDDFTDFPALGNIITADMRHQMMRKLEQLAALEETPEETLTETPEESSGAVAAQPRPVAEAGDTAESAVDGTVDSTDSEGQVEAAADAKNTQDPDDPALTEEKHHV
jgi:hypothetical protein